MEQARIYQRSGHQVEAIQSFLEAARLKAPSPDLLFQLGMSFFLLREYERAAKHFEQARKLDEKNDKAEFMLSVIDVIKDNNEAAKKPPRTSAGATARKPSLSDALWRGAAATE